MNDSALLLALRPVPHPYDAALAEHVWQDVGFDMPQAAQQTLLGCFGCAPYLGRLARRYDLRALLTPPLAMSVQHILDETTALQDAPLDVVHSRLRQLKGQLHLLLGLADAGGVADVATVTAALSHFADAAVQTGLTVLARRLRDKGLLLAGDAANPLPGLFVLALGKLGGVELNYSSDIDITVYYDRTGVPMAVDADPERLLSRLAQDLVRLLSDVDGDGYVFRCDLRLRPDPGSTPPAVTLQSALVYYETVGQNWERAALIKARFCAGDAPVAQAFLAQLRPFIWRRTLDYAAISDIHSIKRQIHATRGGAALAVPGAHVKLGRGGIREIEFFAQTQQLILGGRQPDLRPSQTCAALRALAQAGVVEADRAQQLIADYEVLRTLEHRLQMIEDEHTHTIPADDTVRQRLAAFMGYDNLPDFDAMVLAVMRRVNAAYADLFAEAEDLSSPLGSLVFTGVEDHADTLETLRKHGFVRADEVSQTIRGWHHGRIAAMRSARARELFTRLVPRLVDACADTGAPDVAFFRFADFFTRLPTGVQALSLFLANPKLFQKIMRAFVLAPRFARTLAKRPQTLDGLIAYAPRDLDHMANDDSWLQPVVQAADYERALNSARRIASETVALITYGVMGADLTPAQTRQRLTALADGLVRALAVWAERDLIRQAGAFEGQFAVIAMGSYGARDLNAQSDLDLMFVYDAPADAVSADRGWAVETCFLRLSQRLITALSAQTEEGVVFDVDMNLRPSGRKGPIAVQLTGFSDYYLTSAWTWERMALTRARVVWASDADFAARVAVAITEAQMVPVPAAQLRADIRDMHTTLTRAKPPFGVWDLKRTPGGLTDGDFLAQYLALSGQAPISADSAGILAAGPDLADERAAYDLQRDLYTVIAAALEPGADAAQSATALRSRLAEVAGAPDFAQLHDHLCRGQATIAAAVQRALYETPDA